MPPLLYSRKLTPFHRSALPAGTYASRNLLIHLLLLLLLLSLLFSHHQGAHVTINARTEDDVEEEAILKLVAKSSGSNYGFHKEKPTGDVGQTGPVGSVYKKTNAALEIKSKRSDKFWEKMEVKKILLYIYLANE